MISNVRKVKTATEFNFLTFAPKERIVFLDIETTGLKAGASQLYLIGLCSFEEGDWVLTQYFAEKRSDEILLIEALTEFLKQKKQGQDHLVLVTYNGDMFDIPYLKAVEKQYAKTGLFHSVVSFDLYKAVRPYKKIAGLDNLRLKTVEQYCGIDREDPYSGGELIYVYEEFLRLSSILPGGCEDHSNNQALKNRCLECLLLHNGEDLEDLLPTMNMLGLKSLFEGEFLPEEVKEEGNGDRRVLDMRFRLSTRLPKELYLENEDYVVSASGEDPTLLEICVPIRQKRLRLYFADYKEYYYLPAEDMAIHRSVGEFVDRANRVAATARTCYIWEEGDFIPVPGDENSLGTLFFHSWKQGACLRYESEMFIDGKRAAAYAKAVLRSLSCT